MTLLVGDIFVIILVFLISVVLCIDTPLVLFSLRAMFTSKEMTRWCTPCTPWHHLLILLAVISCTTYSLLSQAIPPTFTWEVWVTLGWGLVASLMLIRSLLGRWSKVEIEGEAAFSLFLGMSGSNMLGLLSVGTVTHRLFLDFQKHHLAAS